MARRDEWQEQKKLARLLDEWLDSARTFWTATDPVAPSALSGAIRKQRGVKPGVPDTLVWCRYTTPIAIEMKSRVGKCSASQRAVREALLRAGAQRWMCRSANAAMWALRKSGVKFRTVVHAGGTAKRWRQPKLRLSRALTRWRLSHSDAPRAGDGGSVSGRERQRKSKQ